MVGVGAATCTPELCTERAGAGAMEMSSAAACTATAGSGAIDGAGSISAGAGDAFAVMLAINAMMSTSPALSLTSGSSGASAFRRISRLQSPSTKSNTSRMLDSGSAVDSFNDQVRYA